MDNVYEITLLLDFYGLLLTERQYEILDLHYNNDYSLGEIAEHLEISRQGVFDNIKRAKAALINFEQKLGLVKKFAEQRSRAQEILFYIDNIEAESLEDVDKDNLSKVREGIVEIINKF